jgi:hypothetical protein
MTYRKSYYEQRVEEQGAMREAIEKQRLAKLEEQVKVVEEVAENAVVMSEETKPNDSWAKATIQKWLNEHDIKYSRWMTKAKLLELVN